MYVSKCANICAHKCVQFCVFVSFFCVHKRVYVEDQLTFLQFKHILEDAVQTDVVDIFERHYQIIADKIEKATDEVRDILVGTKKREVTNWWLTYIEEEADKVMEQ